jgi:hypothetical protein
MRQKASLYTVKKTFWKFRNIFMKARTLISIFLNFSILSYRFLNIHLYAGSKLPHTFFLQRRCLWSNFSCDTLFEKMLWFFELLYATNLLTDNIFYFFLILKCNCSLMYWNKSAKGKAAEPLTSSTVQVYIYVLQRYSQRRR